MRYIFTVLFFFLGITQAQEYKAIFDCSSSNANYIKTRMWLVNKTIDMIEKQGDTSDVVLTLHGGCVTMVSKDYDLITPDEDMQNIQKAQEYLIALSKRKNVKIITCEMSLNSNAIDKTELLPFVIISKNSFIDTIKYQNNGYALMTFK